MREEQPLGREEEELSTMLLSAQHDGIWMVLTTFLVNWAPSAPTSSSIVWYPLFVSWRACVGHVIHTSVPNLKRPAQFCHNFSRESTQLIHFSHGASHHCDECVQHLCEISLCAVFWLPIALYRHSGSIDTVWLSSHGWHTLPAKRIPVNFTISTVKFRSCFKPKSAETTYLLLTSMALPMFIPSFVNHLLIKRDFQLRILYMKRLLSALRVQRKRLKKLTVGLEQAEYPFRNKKEFKRLLCDIPCTRSQAQTPPWESLDCFYWLLPLIDSTILNIDKEDSQILLPTLCTSLATLGSESNCFFPFLSKECQK